MDASGNIYFVGAYSVRRIDALTGTISTIAGVRYTGGAATGDGGPAIDATFNVPTGIAIDGLGNIFIAGEQRVRKIDRVGIISTVAGSGGYDCRAARTGEVATSTCLSNPETVVADASGNFYVADEYLNQVLKVDPSGIVTVVAGHGDFQRQPSPTLGDGGPATEADLMFPNGLGLDRQGNLYIDDSYHGVIRKVDTNGVIRTIAGRQNQADYCGGDGEAATSVGIWTAEAVSLDYPGQIAIDAGGNVYFVEQISGRIRKVDVSGVISTVAGNCYGSSGGSYGDGVPATAAAIAIPLGVAIAADGSILITDSGTSRIRRVAQPGSAATASGSGVTLQSTVSTPTGAASSTVQVTFDTVLASGVTVVTATDAPVMDAGSVPAGFEVGEPPLYFDVATSATFSGDIHLCFSWEEGRFDDESQIQLFHYEGASWVDVTTSIDTASNIVCGDVTSLSPFGVFEAKPYFAGFLPPVDNMPTRNVVKAGAAVPVKFSLNGYWGMGIFDSGYPASQAVQCTSGAPTDTITETVNAGSSSLSYDPTTEQYKYVWKTDKSWVNSCRRLSLRTIDGAVHAADFEFAK